MKSFHFIGVGGSGMSALALLAHEKGFIVSGSDTGSSSILDKIRSLGIELVDHHSSSILKNADAVVYSSAIPEDNFEIQLAKQSGKTLFHRSEFLAFLAKDHLQIAVAGSHGKTTTSAMITHVLTEMELDPTAVIGGVMRSHGSNHRCGSGKFFVLEADESDGSFLNYDPFISVTMNIGHDHLDHHNNIEGLRLSFEKFLAKTQKDGGAVLGWDDENCRLITEKTNLPLCTFGAKIGCDLRILKIKRVQGEQHVDFVAGKELLSMRLPFIGTFNVLNALATLSVCSLLELNLKKCAEALVSFPGVDRRMNIVSKSERLIVLDDYAHNPAKIASCIESVRENWPDSRLNVCFQPHRYSRLMTTWEETASSFQHCDLLYVLPVYEAGETAPNDFSMDRLLENIKTKSRVTVTKIESFDNMIEIYDNNRSANDIFLTIGAGDVFKVANLIGEHFGQKEEK